MTPTVAASVAPSASRVPRTSISMPGRVPTTASRAPSKIPSARSLHASPAGQRTDRTTALHPFGHADNAHAPGVARTSASIVGSGAAEGRLARSSLIKVSFY